MHMHPEYAYPCNSMQRSGCRVTVELFPSPLFLSGCFPPCFCKSNQWLRPDAEEKPQLSKQSVSSLQHDMFKMTCRSKKKRRPDEFGGHHSIRELQDERCPNMTEIQIAINIQQEICHFAVKNKVRIHMRIDNLCQLVHQEDAQSSPATCWGHVLARWCYPNGWCVFFSYT